MATPHALDDRTGDFARIADSAPVPMWVSRLDRTRLYVNRAYCAFLGMEPAAARAFDWRAILHPDDAARVVAESLAGEASLAPFTLEARYRSGEEWRWLRSISQPQFDADGNHIGFVGVAIDLTEAKQAEFDLREREQQMRAFIEQGMAGFAQVDLTGRFTLVNDRFCEIAGRSRAELLAVTMQSITHPDDLGRNVPLFEAAVAQGTPYIHEKRYVRPDGSIVWVNNSVSAIRRPDGELYGILAVTLDVTERRLAEAAAQEDAERIAFLDRLGAATAALVDPDQVLAVTTRMVGERLGLSDCAYADVDPDSDTFHIRGDWHAADVPSIVGSYSLATFGSLAVRNLNAGEPLVVNDNVAELGEDGAAAFTAIGIRATVCMPLVKDGRLTALMAIHAAQPRRWTDGEIRLLREVAERCWAHIERTRAQAIARDNDERLRLAIEGGQIGTWDWNLDGDDGNWSDRTYDIMGVPPGTPVTPQLRFSLVHPDDRAWMREAVARLRRERDEFSSEYRILRPDGEIRWVSSHGVVMRDDDGVVVRLTGTIRDVTAQRNAQDALAALNHTLEQRIAERTAERDRMWRLSRDLFVVIGPRRDIRAANPALAALGYAADEVTGTRFDHYLHPDDLATARAAIRAAARAPVGDFGARVRTREGEWRHYSWSAAPGEGEAYVIGRDVTADVVRRAELQEAQEALRQSQKVEALGQLTGGVAHDFNNLLTPIIGNLDLLSRDRSGDLARRQRLLSGALEAAGRARTLVQRLLAFARRQPLKPGPVDVPVMLKDMSALIASTFGPQIRVAIDAASDLPPALADANQLEMAVLNLAVNARDAMPDGGVLTLAAGTATVGAGEVGGLAEGDYLRLSVSDTGTGMDEATLERAIEPFFSTKGVGKGTGLGLSMVHGLASQSGGAMRLASRPGLGTTVEVFLPFAEEAPTADIDQRCAGARHSAGEVLLVDDDDAVRATTRDMLESLSLTVTDVPDGEAALALLRQRRFDLLVTDHVMPGIDGVTLVREAQALHPDLPALVISGYAELADIPPELHRLAKPFRVHDLAAMVAEARG
jgi:PAS domain S-box-containing protein